MATLPLQLNPSVVRHPLEATTCDSCGLPIVLGQHFVWSADGRDYCNETCADSDRHCGCCGRPLPLPGGIAWKGQHYCSIACLTEDRWETVRIR